MCTTRFNTQKFYVLPTQYIYVFCVDLRTNSDYFLMQRKRGRVRFPIQGGGGKHQRAPKLRPLVLLVGRYAALTVWLL